MRYRLYLDETGTQDVTNTHDENARFFSLTGVIMNLSIAGGDATNYMNAIKAEFFTQDPDQPLILHRKEIMDKEGPFAVLENTETDRRFQLWLERYLKVIQYKVICVVIDKRAMLGMQHWREKNPYHYCLQIIIEKYVQWLERNNVQGDVMAERRGFREDKALEEEYERVIREGYGYVTPERIAQRLLAKQLKMRHKNENITGLQIVDLIANPAYRYVRSRQGHPVRLIGMTEKITNILVDEKFDRSYRGIIVGYGIKYLP